MTQELEQFIDQGIRLGAELGYYPTVFMQMRERWGTVGAMKRLVVSGDIQSGFRRLHTLGLRDWSIEAGVIKFTIFSPLENSKQQCSVLSRPARRRFMPRGPRGERRPTDVVGNAVKVARIATGEEQDEREATSRAAAQLGKLGGAARAAGMTPYKSRARAA